MSFSCGGDSDANPRRSRRLGMRTLAWHTVAALTEIAGCFPFWAWLRLARSQFWAMPGIASLVLFAWALTRIDSEFAG
jgi:small multidrug resistance family-3 protein